MKTTMARVTDARLAVTKQNGMSLVNGMSLQNGMSSQNGLSLVEVLVAVAILAVFIIPLFDVLASGHKGNIATEKELIATLYADELMEQVCGMPFEHLPPELEPETFDETEGSILYRGQTTPMRLSALKEGYTREMEIISPGPEEEEYMRLVRVSVRWQGKSGKEALDREVSFYGLVVP